MQNIRPRYENGDMEGGEILLDLSDRRTLRIYKNTVFSRTVFLYIQIRFLLSTRLACGLKFGTLICDSKRIKYRSESSGHDSWEIGEVLSYAMISNPILWEVIGSNLLTSVSGSNL